MMPKIQEAEVLDVLQTLIRMRSCAPNGDELDIVRYIESLFAPYAVRRSIIKHGRNRASLVVMIDGKVRNEYTTAMMGHIDTMPPYNYSQWTYGPFSGHYIDGKVYGIGASNAKSGVTAMVVAALAFLRRCEKPMYDSILCFTADSDGNGIGAKTLLEGGFLNSVNEIVFCDPTGSDISVAQKGSIWLDVLVRGHSRHIMEQSKAVNAVDGLMQFTEKLAVKFNKIPSHRILGKCSVNLTQIETHNNAICMIPGEVSGKIDIRITPEIDMETAEIIVKKSQECTQKMMPGLSIALDTINQRFPVGMSEDAPIVRHISYLCDKYAQKTKIIGQTFYTDASTVIPVLGIPFVVIGPGGKVFNDRGDEHVSLIDVIRIAHVYWGYLNGEGKDSHTCIS